MVKKKVELLAPAGSYQAFVGAVNAGADAVYLGGEKFGARAYAANFSNDEICKALRYAHMFGKKIYLTVNTLIKDKEFPFLYEYLAPLYEAGLDGIIIQDLGVWRYVKETFPDLSLHASTQMAITGEMGAMFLKEMGASRIVPARELSLAEIKKIKKKAKLELECFIHGSMCYCYSGQCLFSSILGGRSGNRGRCAQPCRLPYQVSSFADAPKTHELYPLSLKDMCTIEFIPQLIQAGIDSFKIEGRMKKPEYAAGVTAIYRKYIDAYYRHGEGAYHVRDKDMDRLHKLYIRTELQTGYYDKQNGREMVTLEEPGYLGVDEALFHEIANTYLQEEKTCPVTIRASFHTGKQAELCIEGEGISVSAYGETVQQAQKRPLTKDDILKHLQKTGNSHVRITDENIVADTDAFMPVGQINELRRSAIEAFEEKLISKYNLTVKREPAMQDTLQNVPKAPQNRKIRRGDADILPQLHVTVRTFEQLQAVCKYTCDRVYIDSDYYMQEIDQISRLLENRRGLAIFLALPYVIRAKDKFFFRRIYSLLDGPVKVKGFLVRNLESVFWVRSLPEAYEMVTDTGLYCFNTQAAAFWETCSKECYFPYELNGKECRRLLENTTQKMSMAAYGTIPMMVSANCVKKTMERCKGSGQRQEIYLTDRYNAVFPVLCNCSHCYNVIYNSLPYSLHHKKKELSKMGLFALRLDFVQEDEQEVNAVMDYYTGKKTAFPFVFYTTGHYKRGVE